MTEQLDTLLSEKRRFPTTAEFAARSAYEGPAPLLKELDAEKVVVAPGDYRTGGRFRVPLN